MKLASFLNCSLELVLRSVDWGRDIIRGAIFRYAVSVNTLESLRGRALSRFRGNFPGIDAVSHVPIANGSPKKAAFRRIVPHIAGEPKNQFEKEVGERAS